MYRYESKLKNKMRGVNQKQFDNRIALRRAWGSLFGICLDGFSSCLEEYYNISYTWFSLDSISLYIWIRNNNEQYNSNKLVLFSMYLTKRLNAFFIVHITDINNWVANLSAFALGRNVINISTHKNWKGFFNSILQHILINSASFDNCNRFIHYVNFISKLASRSYYRFLKYNYWSVNYKMWYSIKAFSYLKARQEVETDSTTLFRGFKIHCLGRFSRRQRAKSYWLHLGMVPLNKFKADIDYSNYTIPIKNSLISVKVWVHMVQSQDFPDYDRRNYN